MPGLDTGEIVAIALELAELRQLPADSAIYVEGSGLQRVMVGIDIGPAELLLARQLGCHGVIAHNPAGGTAMLNYPEVLTRHVELMVEQGVPVPVARDAIQPMLTRALLRAQATNVDRTPSVARLLGMPFLNLHLPLDEVGRRVMVRSIAGRLDSLQHEPTVQDVIDALRSLPEFADPESRIMVPIGAVDRPLGRLAIAHGLGTPGSAAVAEAYFAHGVDSVLFIEIPPEDVERLRAKSAGNLIVTGVVASELLGINQFVAHLQHRGLEVVPVSGVPG